MKHIVHRAPVKWNGASFVQFREGTIALIRRRWLPLTAATLAGHLTVFIVLDACLRAVGVPADTTQVALSVEPAGGSAAPTLVVATGKLA